MAEAIDMVEFVRHVAGRQRGRACVVITRDHADQREWAAKLAAQTGACHIDLLELFAAEGQLADNLTLYSPGNLFTLLQERVDNPVAVISGLEFLKASWSGSSGASEEFAGRIETWHDHPAFIFVMQYDKSIAERPFRRFRQYTFVIDQGETYAL